MGNTSPKRKRVSQARFQCLPELCDQEPRAETQRRRVFALDFFDRQKLRDGTTSEKPKSECPLRLCVSARGKCERRFSRYPNSQATRFPELFGLTRLRFGLVLVVVLRLRQFLADRHVLLTNLDFVAGVDQLLAVFIRGRVVFVLTGSDHRQTPLFGLVVTATAAIGR